MPRQPRIEFDGAVYHVMARGNRGEDIFTTREDSLKFLAFFSDVCETYGWRCSAYCLMPNHYHLLIETPEANLSKGMHRLNSRYAQYVNWKRELNGHLLQGRYKAIVVDRDAYLLELIRYIALNPVRAGLSEKPEQWRWSSFRMLTAKAATQVPNWFERRAILSLFGVDETAAKEGLEKFIADGLKKQPEDLQTFEKLLSQNTILGSNGFAARLAERLSLSSVLSSTEPRALADFIEEFESREKAIAAAFWVGGYKPKDISRALSVHPSTVSRAKVKFQREFNKDR
jgi:REP-associated tyrosine transposase